MMRRQGGWIRGGVALVVLLSACAPPDGRRPQLAPPTLPSASGGGNAAADTPIPIIGQDASAMELASERKPKATPIVHQGTGVFTQRGKRAEVVPAAGGGGEISLNAVDTDLREVVKSVLGDTMGAPYVIDARVKGSVTMETSRPLPRAMLLPMLEEVLRLNGAALVKDNDVWHVIPLNEAAKSGLTSRLRSSAPRPDQAGHGLQVVPLRHVGASQMAKILEPFVPPDRVVRVEQARNLLILTGTQAELDSLLDLVDTFDVDWLQGMSFAMYPLASAQAGKLVTELEAVFGDTREGPLTGMIRFVPIERLNSILVISARPEYLKRVQSWIADLDKGGESDQRRLYVYNVKHGSAADLAGVLTQVFNPGAGAAGSGETLPSLAPGRSGGEIGSRGGSMFRGGGGGGSGGGFGGRGFNNNGGGAPGAHGAIAANGHGSGAGSL
ncbi:MAG: hypothetical protein K2Q10_02200, partial [Rhodospirillales bacterium]|nr:hypothetical protein [Rhodospirillales bacterium]